MLSTKDRLKAEFICSRISKRESVVFADMLWIEKYGKAHRSVGEMLRKARRTANNPDMEEGSLDDFLNQMDIGDPDPSNHLTSDSSLDDIADAFRRDATGDWRQRD